MITMSITEDGEFIDEITFDAANLVASDGGVTVIHSDVMQEYAGTGSGTGSRMRPIVAAQGNLLDARSRGAARGRFRGRAVHPRQGGSGRPPDPDYEIEPEGAAAQSWSKTTFTFCIATIPTRITGSAAGCSAATRRASSGCRGVGRPTAGPLPCRRPAANRRANFGFKLPNWELRIMRCELALRPAPHLVP